MADAFFKKKQYHLRFASGEVESMMNTKDSVWLVGVIDENIVGCIYLKWTIIEDINTSTYTLNGHFSSVSVLDSLAKKGIGKSLVLAAEEHIITIYNLKCNSNKVNPQDPIVISTVTIDCGVINLRKDLFAWYGKQGYNPTGTEIVDDEEVSRISLSDLNVSLVILGKVLKI